MKLKYVTVAAAIAVSSVFSMCPAVLYADSANADTDYIGDAEESFYDHCTGIYVGKDAALDGKAIVARCADETITTYEKNFLVISGETGSNRTLTDTGKDQKGFSVPIPDTTYKYTTLMDVDENDAGKYYGSCMNEYGLAINGSVWTRTSISEEWLNMDPLKGSGEGIREALLIGLVACQAKSAREAIEVMASYIEQYGLVECNTILLSDKNEAWIFENYGGTTFAAMKLPDDAVAVYSNQVMIDWVDFNNTDEFIVSDNLKSNLDKLEQPVKDETGRYHIARSVSGGKRSDFSNMRAWRGHQVFAPGKTGEYEASEFYSLVFTPDEKVSVFDVMELCGDRYQGTEYDVSLKEDTVITGADSEGTDSGTAVRPIGVTKQSHAAIIQTWSELPDECCRLQWLAMGNAEHCIFVPAFSGITDTFEKYKTTRTAPYDTIDDSYFFMCRRNAALAESQREYLSQGLKDYNMINEKAMYDQIVANVDNIQKEYATSREAGDKYVTDLAIDMAKEQYDNLSLVYDRLSFCHMSNLNDSTSGKTVFTAESVSGARSGVKKDGSSSTSTGGTQSGQNSGGVTGLIVLSSALGAGLAGAIVYIVKMKKRVK